MLSLKGRRLIKDRFASSTDALSNPLIVNYSELASVDTNVKGRLAKFLVVPAMLVLVSAEMTSRSFCEKSVVRSSCWSRGIISGSSRRM